MTRADALTLRVGDYVTHPATSPRGRPIRVTAVWVNDARTIVLVRLASVSPDAWLDATGYDDAPAGKVWDKMAFEWVTPAELSYRKGAPRPVTHELSPL